MGGTVYLRTNKFEVKLEGITFKTRDFESICKTDFLFLESESPLKQEPVIGIDVIQHPRDPSIVLLILCFGVGCMILKLKSGEPLPKPIFKFLTDKRIRFVGFGIPEKKDLFPFEALGLTKSKVDIGYVASKILDDPKYQNFELAELARKVLGVSKIARLSATSSVEKHEHIKSAICQLFMSTIIAMTLLRVDYKRKREVSRSTSPKSKDSSPRKKKLVDAAKMVACLKCVDTLSDLNESLCSGSPSKKNAKTLKTYENNNFQVFFSDRFNGVCCENSGSCDDEPIQAKNTESSPKKPLKGILKCPSTRVETPNPNPNLTGCPLTTSNDGSMRRGNSKGLNVRFKH